MQYFSWDFFHSFKQFFGSIISQRISKEFKKNKKIFFVNPLKNRNNCDKLFIFLIKSPINLAPSSPILFLLLY